MTAPFTLHLMRHGAPELAGRMLGRTDCAVTAAGIAACVGQARELPVARVVASDLRRAIGCAKTIDPTADSDRRWRELDFGAWDGLLTSEIDHDALWAFRADPDASPPPGGERWSALCDRIGAAVAELTPAPTLVVTHAGAIRAALAGLCGLTYKQLWRFDLPYAVVVSLSVWPDAPRSAQITAIRPCAA